MDGPRKNIRSTAIQINMLVDHMIENSWMAYGEMKSPYGVLKLEEAWTELAARLSNHGPSKSIQQWKCTWRDLKKKARADSHRALQAYREGDTNSILSDQSQKVLRAIGQECAELEADTSDDAVWPDVPKKPRVAAGHERLVDTALDADTSVNTTTVYPPTLPPPSPRTETEITNLTTTPLIYYETSDNEKEKNEKEKARKRPRQEERRATIDIIKEIRMARDEFDVFGEHVAMKIRNLESTHAKHTTQYLINNILYKAAMGEYDTGSYNPAFGVNRAGASGNDSPCASEKCPNGEKSVTQSEKTVVIKIEREDE